MSKPEQLNEWVTLYEGDCLEVLPLLVKGSVDAVVTDPPYGEGFGFDGDADPETAAEVFSAFLSVFVANPGTYMGVFWTTKSFDKMIDVVRDKGWTYLRFLAMVANGTARPHLGFLPRIQPIGLFRIGSRSSELHDRFSVIAEQSIRSSGLTRTRIANELGCDSRLIQKWSRYRDPSWCLPTESFYDRFKNLVGMGNDFDDEMKARAVAESFSPTTYSQDFHLVRSGSAQTQHPCEKPVSAMRWLIRGMPGQTILDPFAGSGTTAIAAMMEGRRCILIERDPHYCDIIRRRVGEADGTASGTLFTEAAKQEASLFD